MRNMVFRLAILAGVLTSGACGDSPTQMDQQQRAPDLAPSGPVLDQQAEGCVLEGLCVLDPVSPAPCDPWMELDWCESDPCMTSVSPGTDPTAQGCPGGGGGGGGGGTPPPPGDDPGEICATSDTGTCTEPEPICEMDCPADGEDEEETDICPQPLRGKTATALVNVAGRNHEFKFTGEMRRVNPAMGRSPAWYYISGPTASNDNWWIAESGKIQLVCWGRWTFRNSLWVGTVYVQDTDLHMVMSAGHPDF